MIKIKSAFLLAALFFAVIQTAMAQSEVQSSILHPKGLLWKIDKQGFAASYLFGTMHVSDPRVTQLPKEVENAFLQTEHFVMEVVLDAAAMTYISNASFLHKGQTLEGMMDPLYYKKLLALLGSRIILPEKFLNRMQPWAVFITLVSSTEAVSQTQMALDMLLQQKAEKRHMQTSGLESVQEQIRIFETMPLADQLWMLNNTIDEIDQLDTQMREMLEAYVERDLEKLVNIQSASMDDSTDIDDKFMYQLLELRNVRMANRMQESLKQGKAFIAIGALHLPGDKGVLHLLEQSGFRVTPVY